MVNVEIDEEHLTHLKKAKTSVRGCFDHPVHAQKAKLWTFLAGTTAAASAFLVDSVKYLKPHLADCAFVLH